QDRVWRGVGHANRLTQHGQDDDDARKRRRGDQQRRSETKRGEQQDDLHRTGQSPAVALPQRQGAAIEGKVGGSRSRGQAEQPHAEDAGGQPREPVTGFHWPAGEGGAGISAILTIACPLSAITTTCPGETCTAATCSRWPTRLTASTRRGSSAEG